MVSLYVFVYELVPFIHELLLLLKAICLSGGEFYDYVLYDHLTISLNFTLCCQMLSVILYVNLTPFVEFTLPSHGAVGTC